MKIFTLLKGGGEQLRHRSAFIAEPIRNDTVYSMNPVMMRRKDPGDFRLASYYLMMLI